MSLYILIPLPQTVSPKMAKVNKSKEFVIFSSIGRSLQDIVKKEDPGHAENVRSRSGVLCAESAV